MPWFDGMSTKRRAPEVPSEVVAPAAKKGRLGCGAPAKYFSYASTAEPDDSDDNSDTINPGPVAQTPRTVLAAVSRTNKAPKPPQPSSSAFGSSTNQAKQQSAQQHEATIPQAPLRTPLDVTEVPGNMMNRLDRKNRELQQTNQEQANQIRDLQHQLESCKNSIREKDDHIHDLKDVTIQRQAEQEKSTEAWKQYALSEKKSKERQLEENTWLREKNDGLDDKVSSLNNTISEAATQKANDSSSIIVLQREVEQAHARITVLEEDSKIKDARVTNLETQMREDAAAKVESDAQSTAVVERKIQEASDKTLKKMEDWLAALASQHNVQQSTTNAATSPPESSGAATNQEETQLSSIDDSGLGSSIGSNSDVHMDNVSELAVPNSSANISTVGGVDIEKQENVRMSDTAVLPTYVPPSTTVLPSSAISQCSALGSAADKPAASFFGAAAKGSWATGTVSSFGKPSYPFITLGTGPLGIGKNKPRASNFSTPFGTRNVFDEIAIETPRASDRWKLGEGYTSNNTGYMSQFTRTPEYAALENESEAVRNSYDHEESEQPSLRSYSFFNPRQPTGIHKNGSGSHSKHRGDTCRRDRKQNNNNQRNRNRMPSASRSPRIEPESNDEQDESGYDPNVDFPPVQTRIGADSDDGSERALSSSRKGKQRAVHFAHIVESINDSASRPIMNEVDPYAKQRVGEVSRRERHNQQRSLLQSVPNNAGVQQRKSRLNGTFETPSGSIWNKPRAAMKIRHDSDDSS